MANGGLGLGVAGETQLGLGVAGGQRWLEREQREREKSLRESKGGEGEI